MSRYWEMLMEKKRVWNDGVCYNKGEFELSSKNERDKEDIEYFKNHFLSKVSEGQTLTNYDISNNLLLSLMYCSPYEYLVYTTDKKARDYDVSVNTIYIDYDIESWTYSGFKGNSIISLDLVVSSEIKGKRISKRIMQTLDECNSDEIIEFIVEHEGIE